MSSTGPHRRHQTSATNSSMTREQFGLRTCRCRSSLECRDEGEEKPCSSQTGLPVAPSPFCISLYDTRPHPSLPYRCACLQNLPDLVSLDLEQTPKGLDERVRAHNERRRPALGLPIRPCRAARAPGNVGRAAERCIVQGSFSVDAALSATLGSIIRSTAASLGSARAAHTASEAHAEHADGVDSVFLRG